MRSRLTDMNKKILLLDFGGVVASLGDPVAEIGLSISQDEFWKYWLASPLVRDLETGQLPVAEFLRKVASPLGEQAGDEFSRRFRQWRVKPFANVVVSFPDWASRFHLALLSNTNEIHWQRATSPQDFSVHFDKLFLSFENGHFKPAAEAYTQVVDHYGCKPGDIHFLDDAEKNVLAARESGLNAYQVSGAAAMLDAVMTISDK